MASEVWRVWLLAPRWKQTRCIESSLVEYPGVVVVVETRLISAGAYKSRRRGREAGSIWM